MRPLVLGGARPRDRSEQEVQGYRRALDLIHGEWQKLVIDVATVRRLHVLAQDGSGDAERWKATDKEDYYEALRRSSQGWHEGKHDFAPWLAFFLSIVRRAYVEFEQRAGDVRAPRGAKTQLVEAAIAGFGGAFSLADLERRCPGVSRDMVRRVLGDLRRKGLVVCRGRGVAARWERRGNALKRG